jgi:hypothetical protein
MHGVVLHKPSISDVFFYNVEDSSYPKLSQISIYTHTLFREGTKFLFNRGKPFDLIIHYIF